jgi:hypothetical protein
MGICVARSSSIFVSTTEAESSALRQFLVIPSRSPQQWLRCETGDSSHTSGAGKACPSWDISQLPTILRGNLAGVPNKSLGRNASVASSCVLRKGSSRQMELRESRHHAARYNPLSHGGPLANRSHIRYRGTCHGRELHYQQRPGPVNVGSG